MSISWRRLLAGIVLVLTGLVTAMLWSQAAQRKTSPAESSPARPVIGKSPRYVNPLNIEATSNDGSPQGISLGDPTIVRDGNSYYMFATGAPGGPWVSDDLINWKYTPVDASGAPVPVAPHVVKYDGAFYMAGNGKHLFRSAKILGPCDDLGPWLPLFYVPKSWHSRWISAGLLRPRLTLEC